MGVNESVQLNEKYFGFRIYNLIPNGPLSKSGVNIIDDFIIPPEDMYIKKLKNIVFIVILVFFSIYVCCNCIVAINIFNIKLARIMGFIFTRSWIYTLKGFFIPIIIISNNNNHMFI